MQNDYIDLFASIDQNGCWCCEIPDLHKFIFTGKPGQRFTYFVGKTLQETILSKTVKKLTYMYAVRGMVYLFQPRFKLVPHTFEFICVKASQAPCRNMLPWSDQKLMERGKYHGEERNSEVVDGIPDSSGRSELPPGEAQRNGIGEPGQRGLQDTENYTLTGVVSSTEAV